jgi:chemotaxis methyl-accepting protein methylase
VKSEAEARAEIEANPQRLEAALDALLIGVTEFFRDRAVLEAWWTAAVPYLSSLPRLRIWSIGCSTGAEVDSVALMLAEARLLSRAEILGTDCRVSAIQAARDGCYRSQDVTGLDPGLRGRWFERENGGWRASPELRGPTTLRVADLLTRTEPGPWHLILWRNSAIYLQPTVVANIHNRLAAALAPGGFLVLGRAERVETSSCLQAISRCVYRKDGHRP